MARRLKLKAIVNGAGGRMGATVSEALQASPDFVLVGGVEPHPRTQGARMTIPVETNLRDLLRKVEADVLIDFTNREGLIICAETAAEFKVGFVSGSTGYGNADLQKIERLVNKSGIGAVLASNFAIGAVVLNHLAEQASTHFEYADIYETHHELKPDSPSGTALELAAALVRGRGQPFCLPSSENEVLEHARGANFKGVSIHSGRMPGRVASHTVTFGARGQTLELTHNTLDRWCFMPGVLKSAKYALENRGLTLGLSKVMGLK